MAEPTFTPAPGLPGVPAGSPTPQPVATPGVPVAPGGPAGAPVPIAKPLFGGNVGKQFRKDGLKAGSPEARAAIRAKDVARKRLDRATKAAAIPPPPLPASDSPLPDTLAMPGAPEAGVLGGQLVDPVVLWTPEDFRGAATELVELAEAWRIDAHTRRAVAGKLPRKVVEEVAKDAAFPPGSKRSLSTSSPVTLAKMFNALRVPISLKAVITTAPALVYIIVRDLQTGSRIEKLIALELEREKPSAAAPMAPSK